MRTSSPGDALRLPVTGPHPQRDLPVFPLAPDPVRAGASLDARAVRVETEPIGPSGGPHVAVVTLGCDKNTVDSERMMAALLAQGARVSSDPLGADVVVVNTCGFIQAAKEESIETLLDACRLKDEGAVVAVGCMVERYRVELSAEIPEVDLYLGLADLPRLLPELRLRDLLPQLDVPLMERPLRVLAGEHRRTSFLKISEGCDHTCAFCAIPSMRGLHRSAPLDDLVDEAAALGRNGVREINVVSQDTTSYGRDLRRRDPGAPLLPELLRALLDRTGIDWYRLFYMYPSGITPTLVELLAEASGRARGTAPGSLPGHAATVRQRPYPDSHASAGAPGHHPGTRLLAALGNPGAHIANDRNRRFPRGD